MEKIKGKTSTGLEFEIDPVQLDNMEFIETLANVREDMPETKLLTTTADLARLMLSKEMKQKLYDHVRTEDGRVPIKKTLSELMEIVRYKGNDEEDSEEVKNV